MVVPDVVRQLWSRQAEGSDEHYDIYEIEAIGPALVLHNFGQLLAGMLWIHFIDNDNALAALVRGSSSVTAADVIVGHTVRAAAHLGLWSWYDRVDTKSNPVDGLSRGRLQGPWDLRPIVFPPDLLAELHREECRPLTKAGKRKRRPAQAMQ